MLLSKRLALSFSNFIGSITDIFFSGLDYKFWSKCISAGYMLPRFINKPDVVSHEFLLPGSVCAIAADKKIHRHCLACQDIRSNSCWRQHIRWLWSCGIGWPKVHWRAVPGVSYKQKEQQIFKEMLKKMFFYRSSVVYPVVNHEEKKTYTQLVTMTFATLLLSILVCNNCKTL